MDGGELTHGLLGGERGAGALRLQVAGSREGSSPWEPSYEFHRGASGTDLKAATFVEMRFDVLFGSTEKVDSVLENGPGGGEKRALNAGRTLYSTHSCIHLFIQPSILSLSFIKLARTKSPLCVSALPGPRTSGWFRQNSAAKELTGRVSCQAPDILAWSPRRFCVRSHPEGRNRRRPGVCSITPLMVREGRGRGGA